MSEDLIPVLSEMRRYYAECAENAMPGSRAERKFTGYYTALDQAIARLSQEPKKRKNSGDNCWPVCGDIAEGG